MKFSFTQSLTSISLRNLLFMMKIDYQHLTVLFLFFLLNHISFYRSREDSHVTFNNI